MSEVYQTAFERIGGSFKKGFRVPVRALGVIYDRLRDDMIIGTYGCSHEFGVVLLGALLPLGSIIRPPDFLKLS